MLVREEGGLLKKERRREGEKERRREGEKERRREGEKERRREGEKERRREEVYLSLADMTVGWVATAFGDDGRCFATATATTYGSWFLPQSCCTYWVSSISHKKPSKRISGGRRRSGSARLR
jgi:hypothetical protein